MLSEAANSARLISWLPVFLANQVAQLVDAVGAQTNVISGPRSPASFTRLGPDGWWQRMSSGYSLRTLIAEDGTTDCLAIYNATWPKWGIQVAGVCWRLPTPERRTNANVSSSSRTWPTPDARDSQAEGQAAGQRRWEKHSTLGLQTAVLWPTVTTKDGIGARNYRTDGTKYKPHSSYGPTLTDATTLWPTPQAGDSIRGCQGTPDGKRGRLLPYVAASNGLWATPAARDFKSGTGAQERPGHALPLSSQARGKLNPAWVASLMAFPVDWFRPPAPRPASSAVASPAPLRIHLRYRCRVCRLRCPTRRSPCRCARSSGLMVRCGGPRVLACGKTGGSPHARSLAPSWSVRPC